ncbi:EAL domain-containing protein [Aeromonas schubertii]|uniref:EAL domain-containing protein n=1 Tax=Aeromonas schubertii TaxID=652 RepID=UPI002220D570|nr:EAL domain-containing protein [Aeromonas schubertii]
MRHSVAMYRELGITVLAEGVETREELECLQTMGVDLMQGYFFARPGLEKLPPVDFTRL